ncbi:MAG: hypothetical protein IT187_06625, partial [Geothrix sp.]|nr:hypothetical protein [Geothrix sp.]
MALSLRDCSFFGPALPEPFVLNNLEAKLNDLRLLPRNVGDEGRASQQAWEVFRRKLRDLGESGEKLRVFRHVLEPLAAQLGYTTLAPQGSVITREDAEDGGTLFLTPEGQKLRVWATAFDADLDAPNRRGRAYRFSPSRVAQRVLLVSGERAGLLTNGDELRLLICDPARPDSHIAVNLSRSGGWRSPQWARTVPDSYRFIRALASPAGVVALPDLADAARLAQSQVTKKLRVQARKAIEGFLQEVLDSPENQADLCEAGSSEALARQLWREGLILVYRLLFVFKLESSADPARAFSFASTSLWRRTYSPSTSHDMGDGESLVHKVLHQGIDSGSFLESGLRTLWRMFAEGMSSSELEIKALGGMLFGEGATPLLDRLAWGERAVARLLDALLWTPVEGRAERERVHYGALDVEDLGRVYEALLELEPGISTEPMCRLRRAKLEVVVPAAQGAPYRGSAATAAAEEADEAEAGDDEENAEESEEETSRRRASGGGTQVAFIEDIPAHRFFLRVGLGRKATGSYYTPHPFVRFLVQETLGPQLLERSPKEDPQPGRILELKAIDPAMGSGHFLVEACRYLGEALYEACRLCDELAVQAEEQAAKLKEPEQAQLLARAVELRKRVADLPDPEDELVAYLPSRVPEGEDSGLSQKKAEALCRRLVAVHCLYGVDKNPLAVELAKLSLWLESYAEGLPLTFMDHRLVCGDSLTGPFFEHLLTYPGSGTKLDDLYTQGLTEQLRATLAHALTHVRDLEASVGKDVADLEHKRVAKEKLDAALKPLKLLAAAWSGGVMLGEACDDGASLTLATVIANSGDAEAVMAAQSRLQYMVEAGQESMPYELAFPEVFPSGDESRRGFDAVIGNPPWDAIKFDTKEFLAAFDLAVISAPTKRERLACEQRLRADIEIGPQFDQAVAKFECRKRANDRLFLFQKIIIDGDLAGRQLDEYRVFCERGFQLLKSKARIGFVVPEAFHGTAGAAGVRRLYMESGDIEKYYHFKNKRNLFEITQSLGFSLIVCIKSSLSNNYDGFKIAFNQEDPGVLFLENQFWFVADGRAIKNGNPYMTIPAIDSQIAADVRMTMMHNSIRISDWSNEVRIRIASTPTALHMTHESSYFIPASSNLFTKPAWYENKIFMDMNQAVVHEGKTFFQWTDRWDSNPRYLFPIERAASEPRWRTLLSHYKIAIRAIVGFTEQKSIAAILCPGSLVGNSALIESSPEARSSSKMLQFVALLNSISHDWWLRAEVDKNVNLFLIKSSRIPKYYDAKFISHSAIRLSCNHAGYEPLWSEQLGDVWREPKPKHTWPILEGDESRWAVRAAIDAVVAEAYGLDRDQYAHVLSTFSHRSYPKASELCLAAFDELKSLGLEAFTQKHDPYWDIPLNESLPQPVIDLPIPGQKASASEDFGPMFAGLDGAPPPPPPPPPQ